MLFCFESKCVVLRFISEPVGLLNDLELFIKVFFEVSGEKEKYFTRSQAAEAVGGHCCAGALMRVFRSDSQSPLVLMMQSTSVYVSRISSNGVFLWIGIDFIPVDDITLACVCVWECDLEHIITLQNLLFQGLETIKPAV